MTQAISPQILDFPSAPPRSTHAALAWSRALRGDRWTAWHLVAGVMMASLAIAASWPAWLDIITLAGKDAENSHIWLVPLVGFCLVYVRRLRFRHCKPVGQTIGVFVVAFGWAVSSYGFYHQNQSFWHGGSVIIALGCVLAVLGKQVLFRFLPACAVLAFLVPVPGFIRQQISIPLQLWTAQIAQIILETMGVAVERCGNGLLLNGRQILIAEGCNGLRMVWPLILMSFAFSFSLPLRNWVRMLILLASPLTAIFCNIVRILPTVWLLANYPNFGEKFHDYGNWLMLPVSFLLLIAMLKLLRWAMVPVMKYTLAA